MLMNEVKKRGMSSMENIEFLTTAPLYSSAPRVRTWGAVVVLLVIASICAETIATNNTPITHYIQAPFTFFGAMAFYGTAVLLIRELVRRCGLSVMGFVLLGTAFGLINEGVIAGTWYTVRPDGYAFINGVDWGWAIGLTIFHAVYSTAIPIALAEATHPRVRAVLWLNRTSLTIVTVLFLLVSLLYLTQKTFLVQRTIVLIVALVLGFLSLFFRQGPSRIGQVPKPRTVFWLGFAGTVLFYFITLFLVPALLLYIFPREVTIRQGIIVLALITVFASGTLVVRNWLRRSAWSPRSALFLAIGALLPTMLFTALLGWQTGAPFVKLPFLAYLIWLARRSDQSHFSEAP